LEGGQSPIPFEEILLYKFVSDVGAKAAPTFSRSFLCSVAFTGHVLGCESAVKVLESRRLTGAAAKHFKEKRKTQQKPPLSVAHVKVLEEIVLGIPQKRKIADRLMAAAPLPLDRIQGDIQPLLSHLRFQTRFRRSDLIAVIDRFHAKRSRLAPSSATEYRPREANFVADYLAGQGSAFLLHRTETSTALEGIQEHEVSPPHELLLKHNASIFGRHAAGKTVLVLREVPACSSQALSVVVPQVDDHTQRLLRDLALATQKLTHGHIVEYVAAATDGDGRLYAKQACAQHLPKPVRAFVYAQTHQEIDMAGAHYELIRRYANSNSLPHIDSLRATLVQIWGENTTIESENLIKMFPVRVVNAGAPAALRFLQRHHLSVAGFVSSVAFDLDAAKVVCAAEVLRLRPDLQVSYTNRFFYACEYLEMQIMSRFVWAIQRRYRCASIIWLHVMGCGWIW